MRRAASGATPWSFGAGSGARSWKALSHRPAINAETRTLDNRPEWLLRQKGIEDGEPDYATTRASPARHRARAERDHRRDGELQGRLQIHALPPSPGNGFADSIQSHRIAGGFSVAIAAANAR